jgi:hypothetical protein
MTEAYFPNRNFNGQEGHLSVDDEGPEVLSADIDEINKMFNPTAVHEDGTPGGISEDNLNFPLDADMIAFEEIEGLVATTVQAAIAEVFGNLETHIGDKDNPHDVTAAQVTESAYGNVQAAVSAILFAIAAETHDRIWNDDLLRDKIAAVLADLIDHKNNYSNPHKVTSDQVGSALLGTVETGLTELVSRIASEALARSEADAAETEARTEADGLITQRIENETDARASADAAMLAEIGGKAPKSHASPTPAYGPAAETEYGHMRFAFDDEARVGERADKAVTPKQLGAAIKAEGGARIAAVEEEAAARTEADEYLSDALTEKINGRAPVPHASATPVYGAAGTINYGHIRFATNAEAEVGTTTDKAITPEQLGTNIAKEAETRKNSYDLLQTEYENLRADFEAFMGIVGTATWQDIYDNFPTWGDVFAAFDSWLRVRLYVA